MIPPHASMQNAEQAFPMRTAVGISSAPASLATKPASQQSPAPVVSATKSSPTLAKELTGNPMRADEGILAGPYPPA